MNITELIDKYEALMMPKCDPSVGRYHEFAIELLEMVQKNTPTLIKTDSYGYCETDRDVDSCHQQSTRRTQEMSWPEEASDPSG